jgi:hypothetical protein
LTAGPQINSLFTGQTLVPCHSWWHLNQVHCCQDAPCSTGLYRTFLLRPVWDRAAIKIIFMTRLKIRLNSPVWFLPFSFPDWNTACISHLTHACYTSVKSPLKLSVCFF